ncbi:MAG: GGDEF domain-containing protein, partial [Oscillospiraceae bacterium]
MNIQYFMICIIPLGFFFPFKRIECPLIATILAATLYVLLLIHSNKVEPLFNLENYQFVANTIKYTSLITCLIGVILLSYLFSFSVRKKQAQLKHANKVLERIANTDALTGLANRRSMVKSLGVALRNLRTDSIPATVVIGDIDDFKQVNDTYGHDFGDVVLSNISKLMKINLENVG